MLCLGPIKSLPSPRSKLTAKYAAQCTNVQSQVWCNLAIQAPQIYQIYIEKIMERSDSNGSNNLNAL